MAESGFAVALVEDLDPADVRTVVATFRRDTVCRLAELEQAAARGDAPACQRSSHALAGAAAAVGAAALERACRRMMSVPAGGRAALAVAAAMVRSEAAEALSEAGRFLESLPP